MASNEIENTPTGNPSVSKVFASQRIENIDPCTGRKPVNIAGNDNTSQPHYTSLCNPEIEQSPAQSPMQDRRMSREWDAGQVPPSQFQRPKGSIVATPGTRDGHTQGAAERDHRYWDKMKEKGWLPGDNKN